ncbi:MAG TPA: energy transducer TonB [Terriglobia bacterium]|nr:energy transducer TonB [Terriglobia bacterium]
MTAGSMGFHNLSSRLLIVLVLCAGLVEGPSLSSRTRANRNETELQRFYVVAHRVSDAGPSWFDYIFDVKPDGKNVIVRSIRIASEKAYCPALVEVKAAERRLPDISVRQMAHRIHLCSIREEDVDHAIADSKARTLRSIFEGERFGIVAQCDNSQRLFTLPYPETLDMAALKRNAPKVAALYGLESQVYKRAFGDRDIFYDITPAEDLELQRYGASLVAELRSGLYDLGFADETERRSCQASAPCDLGLTRNLLRGYEGPGHKPHEPTSALVDPEKYHLVRYVQPEYPPLAKMARIEGKVEVEISVDRASGSVKQVRAISGHPLLQKSAVTAVKGWVFRPTRGALAGPVSAVLNYSLGCVDSPQE